MIILRDGNARTTGLILNGSELQQVHDAPIKILTGNYQVTSIKKEYGGVYSVKGSVSMIAKIIDYLSME